VYFEHSTRLSTLYTLYSRPMWSLTIIMVTILYMQRRDTCDTAVLGP